jgi:adenosylcobinamide-GDP ribazoletransferase
MKILKGLILNIQFFTSIPIPYEVPMDKTHIEKAIKAFPILGILQGILYSFVFYALLEWSLLSNVAIAFIIWLMLIFITGGIHLDGWIDCSDAYFSYRDRDKRLEIMIDPRTGAFGVISVLILLSARFLFIYEITTKVHEGTFILMTLIPFLGKSIMGILLIKVRAAKEEGLGTLFKSSASSRTLWIYPIYIIFILIGLLLFWPYTFNGALVLTVVAAIFLIIMSRKIVSWFGGITGDVLGASVEGVELVLWITLWLWHYFVMV